MPDAASRREPRWPAMIAILAVGGLRLALPSSLAVGPQWMFLTVISGLILLYLIARQFEKYTLCAILGYLLLGIVTFDMAFSLGLLVHALPTHRQTSVPLLRSATSLWFTNMLIFASWYWRLDAGGPRAREIRGVHTDGAFLFPQMTLTPRMKEEMGEETWSPNFVDYLFLAFNTSTAFSPTDTPVLTRWAKLMMMLQSTVSLTTLALLAARGVNIL